MTDRIDALEALASDAPATPEERRLLAANGVPVTEPPLSRRYWTRDRILTTLHSGDRAYRALLVAELERRAAEDMRSKCISVVQSHNALPCRGDAEQKRVIIETLRSLT